MSSAPRSTPNGGTPGPVHNQIPQPDRTVDNTTIWSPDFTRAYYEHMLFSETPGDISMRNFYLEQSSNRYTVNGHVEDWGPAALQCSQLRLELLRWHRLRPTWLFVRDTVNAWYSAQVAAGKTPDEIAAYLAQFDQWDRYDYDGDGNFNEPDGYIDHFQAVHAGEGEETGGGPQGTDAIWSHRWYAFYNNIGVTGPAGNPLGGIKVGGTNLWIGDYTVEPENGGVGVFSHEYGHDLGLPDLYDTSGNTGGAENSTGFWTLYSSGSYGSTGLPADGIGSKPISMSAYEKIFLDWSKYQVVGAGQKASVKNGPAVSTTKQAQQLVVLLPDKKISTNIGSPYAGSSFLPLGSGNDLDNSMTRSVTLPAGTVSLTAKARYDIEQDWDYAYLTVNGRRWRRTSERDEPERPELRQWHHGQLRRAWVDLTADLSASGGQTVTLGFRYWTDGAVAPAGSASTTSPSPACRPTAPRPTRLDLHGLPPHHRYGDAVLLQRLLRRVPEPPGLRLGLKTGPYNFGFLDNAALGNWVEHYPYQDGLVVWYYDTSFADNNVGDNCLRPVGGLFLPVDAHPALLLRPDNGMVWRPRVQSYDATFGLQRTDKITLHANSIAATYGGLPAVSTFDDSKSYWVAPNPAIGNFGWASVPVPNTGTRIRVDSVSAQNTFMQVSVNPWALPDWRGAVDHQVHGPVVIGAPPQP